MGIWRVVVRRGSSLRRLHMSTRVTNVEKLVILSNRDNLCLIRQNRPKKRIKLKSCSLRSKKCSILKLRDRTQRKQNNKQKLKKSRQGKLVKGNQKSDKENNSEDNLKKSLKRSHLTNFFTRHVNFPLNFSTSRQLIVHLRNKIKKTYPRMIIT